MDFAAPYFEWIRQLARPGVWLERAAGYLFTFATGGLGGTLALAADYKLWGAATGLTVGLTAGHATWRIARYCYLRSGRKHKIGICFDTYRVSSSDWNRTRLELETMFRQQQTRRHVSLRHIPMELIADESAEKRLRRKFGFRATFRVSVSPNAEGKGEVIQVKINANTKKTIGDELTRRTVEDIARILQPPRKASSLADLLKYRAGTFFESILLILSVTEFADRQFDDAEAYLGALDVRLADRFRERQPPRREVRWLYSGCMLLPSSYPPDEVPAAEDLLQITEKSQKAVELFAGEFSGVLPMHARNLFFLRKVDEALVVSKRALEIAHEDHDRVNCLLNLTVLHVCLANWNEASSTLSQLIENKDYKKIDFQPLIRFADVARELGESHAIYLSVLYRQIAGDVIADAMREEFDNWVTADASRDRLRVLFNRVCNARALTTRKRPKKPARK